MDDEDEGYLIHQSYLEAQEEALQRLQEQEALNRALRASQNEADAALACRLAEEEKTRQHDRLHEEQWKFYNEALLHRSQEHQQGAWDCPSCTVVNRPYSVSCNICSTKAPPHVLSFEPIHSKFGVELEMMLSDGKQDGFTLESLAEKLTLLSSPLCVKFCGYTHETMDCWKIVTDASIQASKSDRDLSFELVSPVLEGEPGLFELRSMLESIRALGIATNASCGFHVHVDATDTSLQSLKRIGQCFTSLEDAFDLLVARSWDYSSLRDDRRANGNRYCQSNRFAFGDMSNQQRWRQIDEARTVRYLVNLLNPNNDRYRKLNLTNIIKNNRPSTIEYRNHGCVEELMEAEAWVRLVVRFTQTASLCGPTTVACLLPEETSVRTQLDCLFDIVGCSGLEQYFCVERRLFQNERITNEWKCATCGRRFTTSRSLAQHCAAIGH